MAFNPSAKYMKVSAALASLAASKFNNSMMNRYQMDKFHTISAHHKIDIYKYCPFQ